MAGAKKRPRREVTDDEFRRAYYGLPGDEASLKAASDNRNVIAAVLKAYAKSIPEEDLESCGMQALWRCLQYHRDEYGQKFTTSLHRFVHWECRRELRRIRGRGKSQPRFSPLYEQHLGLFAELPRDDDDLEHVRECVELLPDEGMRRVIRQYYFDGMTFSAIGEANGCSKESARQKVRRALEALKKVSDASLTGPGVFST